MNPEVSESPACCSEQKFAQYVITSRRGWRLTLSVLSFVEPQSHYYSTSFTIFRGNAVRVVHAACYKNLLQNAKHSRCMTLPTRHLLITIEYAIQRITSFKFSFTFLLNITLWRHMNFMCRHKVMFNRKVNRCTIGKRWINMSSMPIRTERAGRARNEFEDK